MEMVFLRRKSLGAGSIRGMLSHLTGVEPRTISVRSWRWNDSFGVLRNDRMRDIPEGTTLIRWGCSSPSGVPLANQINTSEAIRRVNDKRGFRMLLMNNGAEHTIPKTFDTAGSSDVGFPCVLRPSSHAQGKNLWVVNDMEELLHVVAEHRQVFSNGWYASELINKVQEVRVYVVNGRVATVANKTPDNPDAVAWNVAQAGRFDVIRWGDWPLEACRVAVEAFNFTGLDFGGVDVMIDADGRAYVIEVNSAPSLPLLSDGSVSYRQRVMAKCFKWIMDNGRETAPVDHSQGWRGYIHPAVTEGN